ncbi:MULTISPECIES: galactokinase family protein [unclassified Crossiella]|uniref:galactokinase n=1 Tax=unclassified Crossiella TaxID=2620835 RepID=UPI002000222F|nr:MULTISPECIES: galactokinase family protein [unclassified Crossiella]MCK2240343.1 galactokinase [Crossiella sp. S99.2]MCK2253205.1 galactokinase [Crossiella sp. S99.1]
MNQAQRAAEEFRARIGEPTGVWSAPGRVNLIGEHTDYNDGYVLPFAIPHRIAVAAAPRTDGLLSVATLGDDGKLNQADPVPVAALTPGLLSGWPAYPSGVAWSLRENGIPVTGATLLIAGDVPAGAGLSSSHALECATALALLDLAGHPAVPAPAASDPHTAATTSAAVPTSDAASPAAAPAPGTASPAAVPSPGTASPAPVPAPGTASPAASGAAPDQPGSAGTIAPDLPTLARWIQRAENDFVGAPTGLLDQTASLRCVEGHALFLDVRSGETEQVPFNAAAHGLEILVIDTRASHSHTDGGYAARRAGCEQAAELLGIPALRDVSLDGLAAAEAALPENLRPLLRHIVTENARVLATVDHLRAGDLAAIGPILTASHASMRDDYRISCLELDVAVDSALNAGALGARMTGGGFGGSAIALVPVELGERVRAEVTAAFAERKLTPPRLFSGVPAAGAGRDK